MQNSKQILHCRRGQSDNQINGIQKYADIVYDENTSKIDSDNPSFNNNITGTMSNSTKFSTLEDTRSLLYTAKRPFSSNKRSLSESSAEDLTRSSNGTDIEQLTCVNKKQATICRNQLPLNPNKTDASPWVGINKQLISDALDVIVRIAIVIIFSKCESLPAFKREIHEEELWLYKNPRRPDFVTPVQLLVAVIIAPFLVTLAFYAVTKNKRDFHAANWAWTLALCMNGIPTSLLKITVGRLRPDFFYRCFPDGIMVLNNTTDTLFDFQCTGIPSVINEGRKSFPSGHSSFAFASFSFIAYYVGAKLHAFNSRGRGNTWRLCIAVMPFFLAALVAVSRTCDYHHHWQDVVVGAFIGLVAGYVSYRQYYPGLLSRNCHRPIIRWPQNSHKDYARADSDGEFDGGDSLQKEQQQPLLGHVYRKQQSKWY